MRATAPPSKMSPWSGSRQSRIQRSQWSTRHRGRAASQTQNHRGEHHVDGRCQRKDDSVSDTLADLMLRNLSEVFGERDSERRMAAIKNLYSEDAVFFEAEQRLEGRQRISDAVAALPASLPAELVRPRLAQPERNPEVGRLFWRLGPAGSPPVVNGMAVVRFKD